MATKRKQRYKNKIWLKAVMCMLGSAFVNMIKLNKKKSYTNTR